MRNTTEQNVHPAYKRVLLSGLRTAIELSSGSTPVVYDKLPFC